MASPRRKFRDQNHGLRILLRPRFVFRLHLLPDGHQSAATSSSSRTGAGWPGWTRATRFSANGLAATWKTPSACKSATTGSTTAFTRRKIACAWTRLDSRHRHHSARRPRKRIDFTDTQVGFYAENKIQWAEKFRSVAALRGDLEYFDVTSLSQPGQFRHRHQVSAQPEAEFDFRPVGTIRNSMCRADSVFTATTGAARRRRWNRSRRTIPTPIRPSAKIPASGPNQRRGNRRAHAGRSTSAKHRFALVSPQ